MNKEKKFNGFYNYTVILTYISMISGFLGIAALINSKFHIAIIFLMFSGIFDMFDGAVASTKPRNDAEKRFGIEIDSLSDLICFGVFPAVFTYLACDKTVPALICGGVYLLCALIRLAYFNVCEEDRQKTEAGRRKYYNGLPVTTAALIFPVSYLLNSFFDIPFVWMLPALSAVMAFAFVFAVLKLKKPGILGISVMGIIGVIEFILIIISLGVN